MDKGCVEDGNGDIAFVEQHTDLRATEDHAIRSFIDQALCDVFIDRTAVRGRNAQAQLVVDDAMHLGSIRSVGNDRLE